MSYDNGLEERAGIEGRGAGVELWVRVDWEEGIERDSLTPFQPSGG